MSFKRSYLELWQPSCTVEQNHLCKGHHGDHSCEVILNLDQWFRRRRHLKKKFTDGGRRTPDEDTSQYLTLSLRFEGTKTIAIFPNLKSMGAIGYHRNHMGFFLI